MPHGRIRRKSRTTHKEKQLFTVTNRPVGYGSWLGFALETYKVPLYMAEAKTGSRYYVTGQDPKLVRRIMRKEFLELLALAKAGIWGVIHRYRLTYADEASYRLWEHVDPEGTRVPFSMEDARQIRAIVAFSGEFPVISPNTDQPVWMPLKEWRKRYKAWQKEKRQTEKLLREQGASSVSQTRKVQSKPSKPN